MSASLFEFAFSQSRDSMVSATPAGAGSDVLVGDAAGTEAWGTTGAVAAAAAGFLAGCKLLRAPLA